MSFPARLCHLHPPTPVGRGRHQAFEGRKNKVALAGSTGGGIWGKEVMLLCLNQETGLEGKPLVSSPNSTTDVLHGPGYIP